MLEGLPPNGASTLLRFVSDASRARAVADFIVETFDPAETAACVFEDEKTGQWTAEVFFQDPPDEDELRGLIESVFGDETAKAVSFSTIEERDWVENALAGLKPVRAGRILVHGAHDRARLRANDVGVEIEAALAFGTGHHGTTLGCLLALVEVLSAAVPAMRSTSARAGRWPFPARGRCISPSTAATSTPFPLRPRAPTP